MRHGHRRRPTSVAGDSGDAYVVAIGSWSDAAAPPLGISITVYPVKGYSITVRSTPHGAATVSTVWTKATRWRSTGSGSNPCRRQPPKFPAIRASFIQRGRANARSFYERSVPARAADWRTPPLWKRAENDSRRAAVSARTNTPHLHLNTGQARSAGTWRRVGAFVGICCSGRKPRFDTANSHWPDTENRFG